jgi:hypothetical protein
MEWFPFSILINGLFLSKNVLIALLIPKGKTCYSQEFFMSSQKYIFLDETTFEYLCSINAHD